jgi:hypothetical protein
MRSVIAGKRKRSGSISILAGRGQALAGRARQLCNIWWGLRGIRPCLLVPSQSPVSSAVLSGTRPHSRGAIRPSCSRKPLRKTEGAGKAGCQLHPQPRVRWKVDTSASHYRPGLPCAMVYDFLRALLGVLGFLVTVALIIISRLGTNRGVPGPRAFAVRVCVTRHATHLASIASIPRSWRSRSAPHWDGMRAYSF